MSGSDAFDLERFVTAQAPVFEAVLAELHAGRKGTHWMWFIFPQLRGLGHSSTARFYGLGSLEEAKAYLAHPVLGPRLETCTQAVLAITDRPLHAIFGSPDDMKFRSSMTLFAIAAAGHGAVFRSALDRCCAGQMDERTLALLNVAPDGRPT